MYAFKIILKVLSWKQNKINFYNINVIIPQNLINSNLYSKLQTKHIGILKVYYEIYGEEYAFTLPISSYPKSYK